MHHNKLGRILLVLTVAACALVFYSCMGTQEISEVQNGKLNNYPNKTIGQAVDGFFGSPSWECIKGEDGNKYVNVTGSIEYMGKEIQAALQFRIYENSNNFQINALEFNGIPQNEIMLMALLENMYSGSDQADLQKCIEIETVAETAAMAVADYFSDPENVSPPTSKQLAKLGYSFDYPVEVKEIDSDMTIIITDDRNACSSGKRFLYSFNGGSYWAN